MLQMDRVAGNHRTFISQIKSVRFGLARAANYTGLNATTRKAAEMETSEVCDTVSVKTVELF